jgi:hypothetical protein
MIGAPLDERPVPDRAAPDPEHAATRVREWCREHGLTWKPRGRISAVHALPDGGFLTASPAPGLERWAATADEPLWQAPVGPDGAQVWITPHQPVAVAVTDARNGPFKRRRTELRGIDLADGTVRAARVLTFPAVLVSRSDGCSALHDAPNLTPAPARIEVRDPDGSVTATIRPDRYTFSFGVTGAPHLLFLQGDTFQPWDSPWVVSVEVPNGRVRRMFPLEWDPVWGGRLFGGPGRFLDDERPSIIHAGAVHGARPRRHRAFVIRRDYPTGAARWVFGVDHQATGLDIDSELVYVTFESGELVVLQAADGAVLLRTELRVDGHRIVPTSVAVIGARRLAIGTLDGRVLDCTVGTD